MSYLLKRYKLILGQVSLVCLLVFFQNCMEPMPYAENTDGGGSNSSKELLSVNHLGDASFFSDSEISIKVSTFGSIDRFEWYKDGRRLDEQTTNRLYIPGAKTSDEGFYKLKIINTQDSPETSAESNEFRISVTVVNKDVAVTISQQPKVSAEIMSGASESLVVSASGVPAPTYQWYHDDKLIPNATSSSYEATKAGVYYVQVKNRVGAINSSNSTLSVVETVDLKDERSFNGRRRISIGDLSGSTSIIGRVFSQSGVAGTIAIYECIVSHNNDYMITKNSNCEGQTHLGNDFIFYIWENNNGTRKPLYRCINTSGHFASTDRSCEDGNIENGGIPYGYID